MGQASKRGVSGSICVFEKYIVQALLLYSLNPKFYMGKRYKCIQISHFASASGGLRPQAPYRDFAPRSHWGPSVPDSSWPGPHHVTVNPSIVKSWIRLWGNENNRWNGQNCVYRAVNVISFRGGGASCTLPQLLSPDRRPCLHARTAEAPSSINGLLTFRSCIAISSTRECSCANISPLGTILAPLWSTSISGSGDVSLAFSSMFT